MFSVDIKLFNLAYNYCKSLGNAFGFGAFEGLVLYAGVIMWGIITVTSNKKVK